MREEDGTGQGGIQSDEVQDAQWPRCRRRERRLGWQCLRFGFEIYWYFEILKIEIIAFQCGRLRG